MAETVEENNLFFACSLIEYIARKTKIQRKQLLIN